MKNLIISITLVLFAFCLHGQINYSVGMGPQYNFSKISSAEQFSSENNFTYFAKGEVYYTKNKMNFNFAAQWNRSKFIQKFIGFNTGINSDIKMRTDYLNLNPSIGFKPIKFIGINAGGYLGFNVANATFEEITETWINTRGGFNVISQTDYGLSIGLNGFIAQNVSIELKYYLGLKNLWDGSTIRFTDNDGNLIGGNSLKNRNLQLSFNYHFNEF